MHQLEVYLFGQVSKKYQVPSKNACVQHTQQEREKSQARKKKRDRATSSTPQSEKKLGTE